MKNDLPAGRQVNILERQFDRLAKKIRERSSALVKGLGAYFKRLLFPIKLITYNPLPKTRQRAGKRAGALLEKR